VTAEAGAARLLARELVEDLRAADHRALGFQGVDLAGALEQQLFFAIRDGRRPAGGTARDLAASAGAWLRPLAAAGVGLMAWRLPKPGRAPMVVLVREPTHYAVLAQVEAELQAVAGETLALLRVGRAAAAAPPHAVAPRLAELMEPGLATRALGHHRLTRRALRVAVAVWRGRVDARRAAELFEIASVESGRIALGAAALLSAARCWRPALLAGFDEIGTLARLLPEVARSAGVPSLDLPHAEAADASAIQGASYDCMATYGPRATAVLRAAGVPAERIVEIGAPRLDPLVRLVAEGRPAGEDRQVLFAAQYVAGAMTFDVMRSCYRAALAAARAIGASEVVVVPHPAEEPGTAARVMAPAGPVDLPVRVSNAGLHLELTRSRLLVTGWSNAVFEAAVAGIPAIAVNPGGVAPVDFAADGLAVGASDEASAARAAASLRDEETMRAMVERARAVATQRLGPLDGRASERAARLMLSLARGEPRRSAA
jgi:hypothetical protein